MIDAKSFMKFFEKEFDVQFVDIKTGKKALDIVAEDEKKKSITYRNPTYKSDYDKFIESGGDGDKI